MKLYIVYLRTMENSPEVTILSVTGDPKLAYAKFTEAQKDDFEDEDSGDWRLAGIAEVDFPSEVRPGDMLRVVIETDWVEAVESTLKVFRTEDEAMEFIAAEKERLLEENPDLVPFDEDETIEESMHLRDEDLMEDVYFGIDIVIVD